MQKYELFLLKFHNNFSFIELITLFKRYSYPLLAYKSILIVNNIIHECATVRYDCVERSFVVLLNDSKN